MNILRKLASGQILPSRVPERIYLAAKQFHFAKSRIPLDWDDTDNWGDKLNPYLVEKLTGKQSFNPYFNDWLRYFVIGSILDRADKNSVIWGSGFISANSRPSGAPNKIHAVRGPLTRDIFVREGIDCPSIFGDPAILLKIYFPVRKDCKYEFGIIPHFMDKDSTWIQRQSEKYGDRVLLIDIEESIESFIEAVCSCKYIFSSSLHGLICADTYGIPSIRIVLGEKVTGGDFKFNDYRLGLDAKPHTPIDVRITNRPLHELVEFSSLANAEISAKTLLATCPFLPQDETHISYEG